MFPGPRVARSGLDRTGVNKEPDVAKASKLTSTRNHVVRNDDVMTFLVIARRVVGGRLRQRKIRAGEKILSDDVGRGWLRTSLVTAPFVEAHCFEVAEAGTPLVIGFLAERGVSSRSSLLRFLGGGGRIAVDVLADRLL